MRQIAAILSIIVAALSVQASLPLESRVELTANASSGTFAPYMIGSWNYGKVTEASGIWLTGFIRRSTELDRRFSWGAGVELQFGYGTGADYRKYENGVWGTKTVRQSPASIRQLYGELKFRGVFLTLGMKNSHSHIVDDRLSSGDLTRSNNARAIPGVAAGFVDFQDIPFTNGWVQIDGEIMYGKMTDNSFIKDMFNYYSGLLPLDLWYTYKRCYFRTKPSQPLSVTVGMQTAGQFAGSTSYFGAGEIYRHDARGFHIRDLWEMFFPLEGSGEDYYKGNSLGSWDFKARWRFESGSCLSAYFEWPWEDGSGIGRQNGWDGVWGLQYDFARRGIVSSLLVEYLDFTNQSGPIHYAPGDDPGTSIPVGVTGGDNYYNNDFYGAYTNYGLNMGTAFLLSPRYNLNGDLLFRHNRARGFHLAALGNPVPYISYRAMLSYQRAGGTGRAASVRRYHSTSAMLEGCWTPSGRLSGFELKVKAAFDAGSLRGDNFGMLVSVAYNGIFKK